ncbi:hypothetical protein ElyMa_001492000 [Elysia marginata]|uniref:Uncharacterized protein n=1 Tax=Elysia marginata TaxID=1093978 RepID=A0AAV4J5J7_9GAST|nr:hypothetical protein ElyMa_001492000 [Elysia marginata]
MLRGLHRVNRLEEATEANATCRHTLSAGLPRPTDLETVGQPAGPCSVRSPADLTDWPRFPGSSPERRMTAMLIVRNWTIPYFFLQ